MRRFLAAIFRTHGDDLEPLLALLFSQGGETNLLLRARTHPRRGNLRLSVVPDEAARPGAEAVRSAGGSMAPMSELIADLEEEWGVRHVRCSNYQAHVASHRYVEGRWICETCQAA
jgi:hypothetical protein